MSSDPFHGEAARDLLGIVRVMYAVARREHQTANADRLREAGELLRLAVELSELPPGTMGHRAAWMHGDNAIKLLASTIELTAPLKQVVEIASDRLRTPSPTLRGGRQPKRDPLRS